MALHLKHKPKTLTPFRSTQLFSSSSSPNPPPPLPPPEDSNGSGEISSSSSPPPPPPPSYSSYFSDIKERLKSPPSPPRRIPIDPPPPPSFSSPKPSTAASLDEIRKHLADFRLKSSADDRPSSPSPISFQDLLNNNVLKSSGGGGSTAEKTDRVSFDSIRESLRKFQTSTRYRPDGPQFQRPLNLKPFQDSVRTDVGPPSLLGGLGNLPESIFGKEFREKKGEAESKVLKTEFVKMYSYEELGEKLRKLRPEVAAKGRKDWFSLTELNERLAKLREFEEKETESKMGGVSFRDLRESLVRLKNADADKKSNSRFFFFL